MNYGKYESHFKCQAAVLHYVTMSKTLMQDRDMDGDGGQEQGQGQAQHEHISRTAGGTRERCVCARVEHVLVNLT